MQDNRVEEVVLIEAPLDRTWELTNDLESWPTLFSECAKVEILERDGDTTRFRFTTNPHPDGSVHTWEAARTTDRLAGVVTEIRVDTGPFKNLTIAWKYDPAPGGTRLKWTQDFTLKTGVPHTPESAAKALGGRMATELARVKRLVEESTGTA